MAWTRLNDAQKLDLLRAYSLAFTRMGPSDAATRARLVAKFDPLFPATTRELNVELAQMLVFLEAPSAATKVVAKLENAPTQEEQMDYARALRVLKTGWNPQLRKTYFQWYLKAVNFRGGASLSGFLRDMKADAVANLDESSKLALKPILEAKPERKSPMALLGERTVFKEWTVRDLEASVQKGLKKRNYNHGREIAGAVGCFNCHRFDNEGGAVGPDLTGVAGRFNARDLLESILEPSKEVSDQYAAIVVRKHDDTEVTGRIVNLNEETLMVNANMLDPNEMASIKRSDIKSIEPSKMSMMPEGLLNALKEDEILDLVAFLLSRGDRNNKMFR